MPRTGLSAEQIKERAIDAALARMRLLGVDKVRLTDIARELGVSHVALYAHFADKEALLDAVTERWLLHVEQTVMAIAVAPGAPTARMLQWLVTLYQLKRARALAEPEPHRAFDVAAALKKPFVITHLAKLLAQLSGLFSQAGAQFDGDADANARLLYTATAAYHHPTIIEQTADQDNEATLRAIIHLTLLGMERTAIKLGRPQE